MSPARTPSRRRTTLRKPTRCRPQVERLEPRLLMTATPTNNDNFGLLSHGGVCSCPICSGRGIELIQAEVTSAATTAGALSPLNALPALHSRAGAAATIYLDFNGHTQASWGGYTNVVTRVFDRDGDATTFRDSELATITEIWTRVSEDFAPFNINVTTVDPGSMADRVGVRVAIGGNWSDWFGQQAGGVAYVGAFYNSAPNVAYVFEDALGNGTARYVAEAASHEAGHTFGLLHQSLWENGQLVDEYYEGNSAWAPIMGVGYYSSRTTWHNGTDDEGPTSYQDDMAILANSSNGFGYRADDFGSSLATASALAGTGNSVNFAGLIGRNDDQDFFRFSTSGGALDLQLNVTQFGANLDTVLELRNASGTIITTVDPSTSFGASLQTTVGSGDYFLVIRSSGGYGNVGQYRLTGTVAGLGSGGGEGEAPSPEINLAVNGTSLASGGSLFVGNTQVGTPVSRTVTITNSGNGALSLTSLTLPNGFSLVSNLGATSLAAGQSTTFTFKMNATAAGTYSGTLTLLNSDNDEGTYQLTVYGSVTAAPPPPVVRIIDNGAAGFSATSGFRSLAGQGRERDIHYASRGTGTAVATYTFTSLPPGQYRVSASWTASSINATNTPISVYNGTQLLGTVRVNQERASSGLTDSGTNWSNLGNFTITGDRLVVKLTNSANDRVIADAIRIERIDVSSAVVSHSPTFENVGATANWLINQLGSARAESTLSGSLDSLRSDRVGAAAIPQDAVFSSSPDLHPEAALLEEVLNLLGEVRSTRSSHSSATQHEAGDDSGRGDGGGRFEFTANRRHA